MTTYVCSQLDTATGVCNQWVEYIPPSLWTAETFTVLGQLMIVWMLFWFIKSLIKIVLSLMGINI